MNNEDQFEKRLDRLPQRPIPAEWRAQILSAARQTVSPSPATRIQNSRWSAISALLWPHPKAWAGLSAVWVLIVCLDLGAREPARPELARQPLSPPSPQMRQLLREQEQLLAELAGPSEPIRAVPARPQAAQPRSERPTETMNA